MVEAVRRLAIRGAPAIGVAGAYAALLALRETGGERTAWEAALGEIEGARPTAVNLGRAVERIRAAADGKSGRALESAVEREAGRIAAEDAAMCEAIARHGLELVPEGSVALTHCNTGALVTCGIGTALGVLRRAHEAGRLKEIYACEARPLGQGARLTMWELGRLGVPATLLCDSAAGRLMQERRVDFIIVGADRIARNGDTANKVGTLQIAVLAERFGIPFYIAAPSSTFDPRAETGEDIPVEMRAAGEVLEYQGCRIAPVGSAAYNPAFDITPGGLIHAFVREDGIYRRPHDFGKMCS